MDLTKKKELAARALNIGKDRIIFNNSRLDEIKDAITKQDIKDLFNSKAIAIKEIKGRKTKKKRKTRIRQGHVRKKVLNKKREYIIFVRKLRKYLSSLKKQGAIKRENYLNLRKEIRARTIKSISQLKERIKELAK